jgi:hypothetical protein
MRSSETFGRRQFVIGLGAGGLCLGYSGWVQGSTVIPISLPQLVQKSQHILVGNPKKGESLWEATDTGKRIVTYSEIEVTQTLDGRPPSQRTLLVRTLGGSVGDIGQTVHGEADLERDVPSVLFLRPIDGEVFGVTAMAQGHYPLRADSAGRLRMSPSPRLAHFVKESDASAVVRLNQRTLSDCEHLVLQELGR